MKIAFQGKKMEFITCDVEFRGMIIQMTIPDHDPDTEVCLLTHNAGIVISSLDGYSSKSPEIFLDDPDYFSFETHPQIHDQINDDRLCGFVHIKQLGKIMTRAKLKVEAGTASVFDEILIKRIKRNIEETQSHERVYETDTMGNDQVQSL